MSDPMHESWFRERAGVLAGVDPPASPFGTASVLRRAERARRRRVLGRAAGGGVVVAAVCSAVLATAAVRDTPAPTPATPTPAPVATVLTVTCTPDGIQVDRTQVAASRDGVHLRVVDASGRSGTVFAYRPVTWPTSGVPGSAGGGEALTVAAKAFVLPIPPGELAVECTGEGRADARQVVKVTDPQGWFRAITVAGLGCPVGAIPDWESIAGSGGTPQGAAEDLVRRFGDDAVARRVMMVAAGYVGGRQPFIVYRAGRPSLLGVATRSGSRWTATREYVCGTPTEDDRTPPWPDVPKVDACSMRVGVNVPFYGTNEGRHIAPIELARRDPGSAASGGRLRVHASAPGRQVIVGTDDRGRVYFTRRYAVALGGGWRHEGGSHC